MRMLTRRGSLGLVLTLTALSLAATVGADAEARGISAAGLATSSKPAAAAGSTTNADGSTTETKTVTRTHIAGDGSDVVADTRNVSVTVSTTTNLRSRQVLDISWTGAHPTGGIAADPNSSDARNQEYPFLIFECRGVDDATAPTASQISQQSCWSQTPRERFESDFNTAFPAYRVDRYGTVADRAQIADKPSGVTCDPASGSQAEHFVPFVSVTGATYAQGGGSCSSIAPEQTTVGTTSGAPADTTYAATGTDGTGSTKFTTWTSEDNNSLGCSDTVPCSLVAVPIMGISCDPTGSQLPASDTADRPAAGSQTMDAANTCEAAGKFAPGSFNAGNQTPNQAVTGDLWWSASNWRNRISFPMDFAPLSNLCSTVTNKPSVQIYGSELLTQATSQWVPKLCTQSGGYVLRHVQTGEPQARNIVNTGNAEAAFTVDTPDGGYTTPTVSAPTAITGFTFAYAVDDKDKQPVTDLKLTPRLIAKLLTESYPAINTIQKQDPALSNNPLSMAKDPEFQALNPTVDPNTSAQISAATALILSSDSDVIQAVTSYLAADPETVAWLKGAPDPWGMTVNPAYKTGTASSALTLPTQTWPLLDTYVPNLPADQCQVDDPVPYLPLVAAPTQRIASISQNLQYDIAASQTTCQSDGVAADDKRVAAGRQSTGSRFVIGLTSLGDAARYGLATAALETHTDADAPAKFSDATGRTFSLPTQTNLKAASNAAVPDSTTNTWRIPADALRDNPVNANAYPGTMIVDTALPTTGLPAADASVYAQFLRFVAGDGQVAGTDIGQLPAGYLPMTSGNGQGRFVAYTMLAADAVAAQAGAVPLIVPATAASPTPSSATTASSASGTGTSTTSTPASGSTGATARATATPKASSTARTTVTKASSTPTPVVTSSAQPPAPTGSPAVAPTTAADTAGAAVTGTSVGTTTDGTGASTVVPTTTLVSTVAPDAGASPQAAAPSPGDAVAQDPALAPSQAATGDVAAPAAAVSAGTTPSMAVGSKGLVLPLLLLAAVAGMALVAGDVVAGRRRPSA